MSRPLAFNDRFTGRFKERTLQTVIKKLLRRIATLQNQVEALNDVCLNYARCKPGCQLPGSTANGGKSKPCTCGWLEAHSRVYKALYNKDLIM